VDGVDRVLGQRALELARRISSSIESGSAIAVLD
jgi:hypothetical protein